jgi:hypothetical protein
VILDRLLEASGIVSGKTSPTTLYGRSVKQVSVSPDWRKSALCGDLLKNCARQQGGLPTRVRQRELLPRYKVSVVSGQYGYASIPKVPKGRRRSVVRSGSSWERGSLLIRRVIFGPSRHKKHPTAIGGLHSFRKVVDLLRRGCHVPTMSLFVV